MVIKHQGARSLPDGPNDPLTDPIGGSHVRTEQTDLEHACRKDSPGICHLAPLDARALGTSVATGGTQVGEVKIDLEHDTGTGMSAWCSDGTGCSGEWDH